MDFWYRKFFDINNAISYNTTEKQISLDTILTQINWWKVPKWELENEEILVDMCNVERRMNNLVDLEMVNEISSDKNILQNWDIVIPKMQPRMGNIFLNTSHERYLASTEFIEYKIHNQNPMFLYYVLSSKEISNSLWLLESWKTHRRVSSKDLLKIKIPDISIEQQNKAIEKIEPIEQRIKQLKATIKPVQEVIDEVFTRELWFNKSEFVELKKKVQFKTSISNFWNNRDLRNSCKFHRPSAYMLQEFLNKKTNLKLKHFLKEDIVLWAGISPKDFDENGTAYYVSMATIKTYEIELDDTQLVSEEYYASNKWKNVLKNDIIIARSGVAIWKTAIAEDDFDWIFADFTMRIRVNPDKCIPLFAYYYIRSKFFQYLIEVHKKGLQNQNIFPAQIQEFSFPNFSLTEQERIVEEIQTEIDKQNEIREQIQQERSKIDEIVESIIRN